MAIKTYITNKFNEYVGAKGTYKRIYPDTTPLKELAYRSTTYGWERELEVILPKEGEELKFVVRGDDGNNSFTSQYFADLKGVYFVD